MRPHTPASSGIHVERERDVISVRKAMLLIYLALLGGHAVTVVAQHFEVRACVGTSDPVVVWIP